MPLSQIIWWIGEAGRMVEEDRVARERAWAAAERKR